MSKRVTTCGYERRAKVVVTLEQKLQALDMLQDGASVATVSQCFGVGETTVRDWRKAEVTIRRDAAAVVCAGMVKVIKRPSHRSMEQRLFEWISATRLSQGNLTQAVICQKARDFYHELNEGPDYCPEFSASPGWFRRFCRRFSLDFTLLFGQSKKKSVDNSPRKKSKTVDDDRKTDALSSGVSLSHNQPTGENSTESADGQASCDDGSVPFSQDHLLPDENDQTNCTPSNTTQRPESYKLRHNNHFNLVLESLAGDESFMDVTLTAEGRAIKAHKSVLSAVSPYFRSVLKENPCQHPIIIMPRDIRFDELNNIIAYIYRGEMTIAAEALPSLLKTAEVLEVSGLTPSDSGHSFPPSMYPSSLAKKISKPPTTSASSSSSSSSQAQERVQSWYSDGLIPNSSLAEGQDKIDPQDFLTADMTCIKEEVSSDAEENVEENTGPAPETETMDTPPLMMEANSESPIPPPDPSVDLEAPTSNSQSPDEAPPDPYICPHCRELHRPTSALQTHIRLKHPSKPSFLCHQCSRVFTRQSSLDHHKRSCDS